jgi:hypothetical protein
MKIYVRDATREQCVRVQLRMNDGSQRHKTVMKVWAIEKVRNHGDLDFDWSKQTVGGRYQRRWGGLKKSGRAGARPFFFHSAPKKMGGRAKMLRPRPKKWAGGQKC